MTRENVPGIVDLEIGSMREAYGGRSICSAISKALWMMKRHPVVILDSFARQGLQRLGLRPGHDTYRECFNSWFASLNNRIGKTDWAMPWNGYEIPLSLQAFSKRDTYRLPNLILCGSGTASRMCGSASMEEPTGWMRRVGSALRPILGAVENAEISIALGFT